jgi:hypothetical protein
MQTPGVSRVPKVRWLLLATVVLIIGGVGLRWWTARGTIREIRRLGGSYAGAPSRWTPYAIDVILAVDVTVDEIKFEGTAVPDEFFDRLATLHSLRSIYLRRCKVSDTALSRLRKIPTLRGVILDDSEATDATVDTLSELTQLNGLLLNGTKITDAALPKLAKLSKLYQLGLSHTAVGDAELASLKGLSNLQHLDLSYTNVTDEGLKHLHGSKLQVINLKGSKVTAAGAAALEKVLGPRVIGP